MIVYREEHIQRRFYVILWVEVEPHSKTGTEDGGKRNQIGRKSASPEVGQKVAKV